MKRYLLDTSAFLALRDIGASAILNDCTLVHKDPEFEAVTCDQMCPPYKK